MKFEHRKMMTALVLLLAGSCFAPGISPGQDQPAPPPKEITIDSQTDWYGPVQFNHEEHAQRADCQDCHHHTTGPEDSERPFRKRVNPACIVCHEQSPPSEAVSCKQCHAGQQFYPGEVVKSDNPVLYHIDRTGLKRAYHQACMPCHLEKRTHTSCDSCHALTEKGRQAYQLQDKTGQKE